MSRPELLVPGAAIQQVGQAYSELAEAVVSGFCQLAQGVFPRPPAPAREPRRLAEMRLTLWRFRRAFEDVAGEGGVEGLWSELRSIEGRLVDVGPSLWAWIDAVEVLVQAAERRFGGTPGMGPKKASAVKAALAHVLITSKIELPGVPPFVRPFLFEAITGWSVDAIVLLLNRNALWQPAPVPSLGWLGRLWNAFKAPFAALSRWLGERATAWVLARHPLTADARQMVEALRKAGEGSNPESFVSHVVELVEWITRNRRRILAVTELVSLATKEAERVLSASGPKKKAYATDLVLLFLEDEGLWRPGGVFSSVVPWLVGQVIDGVVHLFKRHRVLPPRPLPNLPMQTQDGNSA